MTDRIKRYKCTSKKAKCFNEEVCFDVSDVEQLEQQLESYKQLWQLEQKGNIENYNKVAELKQQLVWEKEENTRQQKMIVNISIKYEEQLSEKDKRIEELEALRKRDEEILKLISMPKIETKEISLANALSKYVHNNCKDVPHDIGLSLEFIVKQYAYKEIQELEASNKVRGEAILSQDKRIGVLNRALELACTYDDGIASDYTDRHEIALLLKQAEQELKEN